MRTLPRTIAILVQGLAVLIAAACGRTNQSAPALPTVEQTAVAYGPEVRDALARLRAATARFAVLDSAVAAGYGNNAPQCFADTTGSPMAGAMGYHHVNRSFMDARAEVERPEILLYERLPDGRYVLNGAEYIIPYTRWPADSVVTPTIMGQQMLHERERRYWYLHAWAWKPNPSGLFADWNPTVHCLGPAAIMAH